MGFFHFSRKAAQNTARASVGGYSLDLIHKSECAVCPLNNQAGLRHPHMQPYGTKKPLIYILGEAPGKTEDRQGRPFVGDAGRLLRPRIPDKFIDLIRWNNCVRTRPPKNRTPAKIEVEACRPSVERDIMATKPKAIFGFGMVPLQWATKQSRITLWRGRRIPIKVGDHVCWFFPMFHPSYISYKRKFIPRSLDTYGCDEEFAWVLDLEEAFATVNDLPEPRVHTRDDALANIELVTNIARLKELLRQAGQEKVVGLDYETTRLRPYYDDAKILTVAIAMRDLAFAFPLNHSQAPWSEAERDQVWEAFDDFLYEAPCRKVAHHLAFELEWSAHQFGRKVAFAGKWEDTESQGYVLDERRGGLSLEFLSLQYFGIELKAVTGNVDTNNLDRMPLDTVLRYNAVDAKYHRLLYFKQAERIREEKLEDVYHQALRRVPTVALTQLKGIPIDHEVTNRLAKQYKKKLDAITADLEDQPEIAKFEKMTGHAYRPAAWQDVSLMCRKILKVAVAKTDEKTISKIRHPIPRLTLKWRKAAKLRSTYVVPMLMGESDVMFPDGLLHPTILTNSTRTWRTSAEEPNVQNWPQHDAIAQEVRRQIRARPGYKIVAFDYAGIQARNIAMESKDKTLVQAFWDGYDIHSDWSANLLKLYPRWTDAKVGAVGGVKAIASDKKVAKAYRQRAKNGFVFAAFFGAQPPTLSESLKIPERECATALEWLWDAFPEVKLWHEQCYKNYYKRGYCVGLSGFHRRAPVSHNELINTPIQGDEAIIVLDAMSTLSETENPLLQASLEVHDDLTFFWPKEKVDQLAEEVISIMLDVPFEWTKIVPMEVEMSIGDNWGEMEKAGAYLSHKWNGRVTHKRAA